MTSVQATENSWSLRQSSTLHVAVLVAYSSAIFLPMLGRGFIHDDFVHLLSASRDSLLFGLTNATGGPFYAPFTWLTFRFDWFLWGQSPFPIAVENLLLHIGNQFLVYLLVLRLWGSKPAAFWAALGFGLLFPGNYWAVLWISTRAHLLTTAFYTGALIAMVAFLRGSKHSRFAIACVVIFGLLAAFSKESGLTLPAAIALLALYERRADKNSKPSVLQIVAVVALLLAVCGFYFWMRSKSGAVPISVSTERTYTFAPSLGVLWSNLVEYSWRTWGLLAALGAALGLSRIVNGSRLNFSLVTKEDVLFSIALHYVAFSPFLLLPVRSGIYQYLPAVASAVLLGAFLRSFYAPTSHPEPHLRVAAVLPVLLVVAAYTAFTVGQSTKWVQTANTDTIILNQISVLVPHPAPNTFFVLRYGVPDNEHKFPNGFESWGFPPALRLHYSEPSLDGKIVSYGESYTPPVGVPEARLTYTIEDGRIRIIKEE